MFLFRCGLLVIVCVAWTGANSVFNDNLYPFVIVTNKILYTNFKAKYYENEQYKSYLIMHWKMDMLRFLLMERMQLMHDNEFPLSGIQFWQLVDFVSDYMLRQGSQNSKFTGRNSYSSSLYQQNNLDMGAWRKWVLDLGNWHGTTTTAMWGKSKWPFLFVGGRQNWNWFDLRVMYGVECEHYRKRKIMNG